MPTRIETNLSTLYRDAASDWNPQDAIIKAEQRKARAASVHQKELPGAAGGNAANGFHWISSGRIDLKADSA